MITPSAIPALKGGTLTPFWAQEYVGADLAQDVVASAEQNNGKKFSPIPTMIVDSGFHFSALPNLTEDFKDTKLFTSLKAMEDLPKNDHATNVANLIASDPPVGLGAGVTIDGLVHLNHFFEAKQGMDRLRERKPLLTNLSIGTAEFSPLTYILRNIDQRNLPGW